MARVPDESGNMTTHRTERKRGASTPAYALYSRPIFVRRNHRVEARAGRRSARLPDHRHSAVLRLRAGVAAHMRRTGKRLSTRQRQSAGKWRLATFTGEVRFRLALLGVEFCPRLCCNYERRMFPELKEGKYSQGLTAAVCEFWRRRRARNTLSVPPSRLQGPEGTRHAGASACVPLSIGRPEREPCKPCPHPPS